MKTLRREFQSVCLGLVFAAIGFSWALAVPSTQQTPGSTPKVGGMNLMFANPFLLPGQDLQFPNGGNTGFDPQGYDLGDVVLGSQFVRYVTALGGVRPYTFAFAGAPGTTGATMDPTGRVHGGLPDTSSRYFNATLQDAAGVTRLGYFRVFSAGTNPGDFRFEVNRLPTAQVGVDLITNLIVRNQDATTVFSIVPQSIFLDGAPLDSLEQNGLTLTVDGTLSGRPLNSGALTFTAHAVKQNRIALDRTAVVNDQPLTLNILPQTSVQSTLVTTSATLTADLSGKTVPTFTMTALVNMLPLPTGTKTSQHFAFRLGGQSFTASLDGDGSAQANGAKVTVTNNAGVGTLKLTFKNKSLLSLLTPTPADGSKKSLVAEIEIGSAFIGTDLIPFDVRNRSNRVQMTYNITKDVPPSGIFLITGGTARDAAKDQGTQFRLNVLVSNVKGETDSDFGDPQNATIRIGPGFVQSVPLTKRGKTFSGTAGGVTFRLTPATLKGTITTGLLPSSLTGILPLSPAANFPQILLVGIDLQTTAQLFHGDTAQVLYPKSIIIIVQPCLDCGGTDDGGFGFVGGGDGGGGGGGGDGGCCDSGGGDNGGGDSGGGDTGGGCCDSGSGSGDGGGGGGERRRRRRGDTGGGDDGGGGDSGGGCCDSGGGDDGGGGDSGGGCCDSGGGDDGGGGDSGGGCATVVVATPVAAIQAEAIPGAATISTC